MLLADHFLEKYSTEHGKSIKRISTPAIDMLTSYHWPGNVRELENTIERAVLVCDGGVIHAHHLPPTLQTAEASDTVPASSLAEAVEAFERDLIQDALKSTRGNRARAAKLLSTTERILNYKVRKYDVDPIASGADERAQFASVSVTTSQRSQRPQPNVTQRATAPANANVARPNVTQRHPTLDHAACDIFVAPRGFLHRCARACRRPSRAVLQSFAVIRCGRSFEPVYTVGTRRALGARRS
jgi:hypothetical protein